MEASYYNKLSDGKVECTLCPHACVIEPGSMGICRCRVNENGTLIAKTYGEISGMTTEDLTEMGFHFYPDKDLKMLSISAYGCNMNCPYCINRHISQGRIHTEHLNPEDLVERLANLSKSRGVKGVCYTFNEPLIWFEHVRDYAKVVREKGYMNALETNGMVHPDAFRELLPLMDLVNIDYKGFNEAFYNEFLKGDLNNVLENIASLSESGVYYEVTCLLIAGRNDDEVDFETGMKKLHAVASNAKLNLLAVVPRNKEEEDKVPTMEKMNLLREIAKKYFEEVEIVDRDAAPQW